MGFRKHSIGVSRSLYALAQQPNRIFPCPRTVDLTAVGIQILRSCSFRSPSESPTTPWLKFGEVWESTKDPGFEFKPATGHCGFPAFGVGAREDLERS